jgi:hypothetical protein
VRISFHVTDVLPDLALPTSFLFTDVKAFILSLK